LYYMYCISRPIKRTVIFSLGILENNNDVCILIISNLLEENRFVSYLN